MGKQLFGTAAELAKKTDDMENEIARVISDKYADDLETPLMLAAAAGNLTAMHLIYSNLRPDKTIMEILVKAFTACFTQVMDKADLIGGVGPDGGKNEARH